MSRQREGGVSLELVKRLHRLLPNSFWTKIHMSPTQSALLDIVGVYRGFYITIEVKMLGEGLTQRQEWLAQQQEAAGALVFVFERDQAISMTDDVERLTNAIEMSVAQKERGICREQVGRRRSGPVRSATARSER